MQACKNTYDKKTNKVANELINKLGIGKKTKQNKKYNRERQHSPRDSFRCRREGRYRGPGKIK